MANLNSRIVEELPITLPSMREQHQIVQEIETRLSVCDKLEDTIAENLKQADALRQSILKKAFEGKLVPQDQNDEPASELLEKIKRGREELRRPGVPELVSVDSITRESSPKPLPSVPRGKRRRKS